MMCVCVCVFVYSLKNQIDMFHLWSNVNEIEFINKNESRSLFVINLFVF